MNLCARSGIHILDLSVDTPQVSIPINDGLVLALEKANIGLAQIGLDKCFEHVNHAFAAMLDKTCGQLNGKHWRSSVHPEDQERAEEAYGAASKGLKGYVEIRGLRARGSVIYQSLTVIRRDGPVGEPRGFYCLCSDISGYQAEREALALAVESVPSGLILINSAGIIQTVNAAVQTLFGYSREELLHQPLEILLPERMREAHLVRRGAFMNGQSKELTVGRDLMGLRKNGAEIPLHGFMNTVNAPGEKRILCTLIDITERVRHSEQLEQAKKAAESANRAKSDFLARMSHEIRTPMNLIMGMNALLLGSGLSEKQHQHVEISYRNVRRLLRLINGILDLSKVEAGKLELAAEPFDVREVITETAATISMAMEEKRVELRLNVDPTLWPFWIGDSERLQQVLLNLLGNAVKFTNEGRIELKAMSALGATGQQGIRFEVSDTGCGVPGDQVFRIFDAFEQGDGAMNRQYEGSGLGLAIARMLVKLMGGNIWVEEKTGPGTTFVFTAFPSRAGMESVSDHLVEVRSRTGIASAIKSGTRILVAEDNPENVILVKAYLEGLPLVLDFAANGVIACDKRRENDYDLILMDIQMPLMDGYTATRTIREWERANDRAPVAILALTAHALSQAGGESREAGCCGHVSKPVDREDLIAAIARTTGQARERLAVHQPRRIARQLPAFLKKRAEDVLNVTAALAANDFEALQRIGHNCKGIGKGYGFPQISIVGAAVETAARSRDIAALDLAVREFTAIVDSVIAAEASC